MNETRVVATEAFRKSSRSGQPAGNCVEVAPAVVELAAQPGQSA